MALHQQHHEHLSNELAGILSDKLVLLADPGQGLIGSHLYANPESSKIDIVPTLNTRGRLEISTNSLNFGGTSTFQIPPGSFLGQVWLVGTVSVDRYVHAPRGWALGAIDQLKFQISGQSSINNIQISGQSHYDLIMSSCTTKEKRDAIILACGDYLNGTAAALTNQPFAVPLYLPWSNPDINGTFPYDTSTLSSNIIVEIKWKPSNQVFMGENAQTPSMPSAFNSLSLKAHQIDILGSSAFKVSSAMMRDPQLVYSFPSSLVQSFQTTQTVTSAVQGSIVLSALPQGQLCAILVRIVPASQEGASNNQNVITNVGILPDYVNLRYNGQDLIKYDYKKEQQLVDIMMTEGNAYRYDTSSMASISSGTETSYNGVVNMLPLYFDIAGMFNDKHREHVPSYGGSTLEFLYRIDSYSLSSSSVNFYFTYVFNCVFENQNRITSVQV